MSEAKAEMLAAYEWICDDCGRNQYVSAVTVEFGSEEEQLQFAKENGLVEQFAESLPADMNGDFVTYPDAVVCEHCGSEFETVDPHDTDDDE